MINGLKYRKDQLLNEVHFETSRSSGKGGQHVNKTETRVTLVFDLENSAVFSATEKEKLVKFLRSRLSKGILRMSCQESRSQLRNKDIVIDRFLDILSDGLQTHKKRIATKIPKGVNEARLKSKRIRKDIKSRRQKPRKEDY